MKQTNKMKMEKEQGFLIFRAASAETYLDLDFKLQVKQEILPLITEESGSSGEPLRLLFNLQQVELINSHGISGFLSLYDELDVRGGILAFCSVDSLMIRNAFRSSGIEELCADSIFPDEETARRVLTGMTDNQ
ncbi:MAG: STAS domain-containing protein [Calditrichia bacterium]